jgi:hypothetical protein
LANPRSASRASDTWRVLRKLGAYGHLLLEGASKIKIIIVDAYGDDEQYTAFLTVIAEQTPLPAEATLLGTPVTVTAFDYDNEARGLTATCRSPAGTGEVTLADLTFPPDTEIAWIHAAYRRYLRLPPFPADPRPDWTWPD